MAALFFSVVANAGPRSGERKLRLRHLKCQFPATQPNTPVTLYTLSPNTETECSSQSAGRGSAAAPATSHHKINEDLGRHVPLPAAQSLSSLLPSLRRPKWRSPRQRHAAIRWLPRSPSSAATTPYINASMAGLPTDQILTAGEKNGESAIIAHWPAAGHGIRPALHPHPSSISGYRRGSSDPNEVLGNQKNNLAPEPR